MKNSSDFDYSNKIFFFSIIFFHALRRKKKLNRNIILTEGRKLTWNWKRKDWPHNFLLLSRDRDLIFIFLLSYKNEKDENISTKN